MPFVFASAEDEGEWLEGDPAPPRADQFQYIPPPKFGGAPEPVHFSLEPITPEPEPPSLVEAPPPIRHVPPAPAPPQRRSILDILLGWRRPAAPLQPMTGVYATLVLQRQGRNPAQRRQQLFAIAIPELQNAGVRRAYCRYDGGHDEGFAWPARFDMQDGGRLSPRELAEQLRGAGLLHRLYAADVVDRPMGASPDQETDVAVLGWLCDEWASLLLGTGYGTGEYSMYGAFTVDLDACTITDDRNADPIVDNIQIAT